MTTLGWDLPAACIEGCGPHGGQALAGRRREIADLWELIRRPLAEGEPGGDRPARPQDLFRGLDAMIEKAATEELARSVARADQPSLEPPSDCERQPLAPRSRGGEDLPSPDDLFRGLAGKNRKTKLG